jgi:hypothetical protein
MSAMGGYLAAMALDLFAGILGARGASLCVHRGGPPSADERVTYPGKARKALYRDADGNEISFGGSIPTPQ